MNAGAGHAGRLHDHFDARIGDQSLGAVGDHGRACLVRIVERFGGVSAIRPPGGLELAAGPRHVEIGDARDMHAARQPRLRQEHGAEFSGPDQADGDRPAGRLALDQLGMKVHGAALHEEGRNRNTGAAAAQAFAAGSGPA